MVEDKFPLGWEAPRFSLGTTPPKWPMLEVSGGQLQVGDYIQACKQSEDIYSVTWAVYVGQTSQGLGHARGGGASTAYRYDSRLMSSRYRFLVRRRGPQFNEWGEDSL